jgi:eukaryotic-like serine/threonine-protein kinase
MAQSRSMVQPPMRSPEGPSCIDDVVARAPQLGARFDRFEWLGSGGMGLVLAAIERATDRPVAIKLLRHTDALAPRAIARMLREARLTASLRSEHVVRIFEVGTVDSGAPFLVMERLFGIDVAARLRGGAMDLREAVLIVRQACEGVAEAHGLGIVHRDLKPSNLFLANRVGEGYRTKVLDFGIAREISRAQAQELSTTSLTESGQVLGSPRYMAPEQVRGSQDVDGRADIWALGVILYEALSGVSPFRGATVADTFVRIVSDEHVPLRQIAPSVPAGLASLVESCLEKERERRPRSVVELARGLAIYGGSQRAGALRRDPWSAEVEDTWPEPVTWGPARRKHRALTRRTLMVGAGAVTIAAVVSLKVGWVGSQPRRFPRAETVTATASNPRASTISGSPEVPTRVAAAAPSAVPVTVARPVTRPVSVARPSPRHGTVGADGGSTAPPSSSADDPLRLDIRP